MHDTDELSADARTLLEQARGGDDPAPADRARVRRALMATLAGGAGVAASTAASSAAAATPAIVGGTGLALGTKIVAALVLVGAVGTTVVVAPWEEEERPVREAVPQTRVVERRAFETELVLPHEAPRPAEPVLEAPTPEPIAPAPQLRSGPRTQAPSEVVPAPEPVAPSELAAEVALLREARARLNSGDPEGALGRLAAHADRFPDGTLAEERDATRVLALCRAQRRDEARAAAERFLRDRPSSPLAPRVRTSCE